MEDAVHDPIQELEALIFSSRGPATPGQIRRALPDLTPSRISELVGQINESLQAGGRPYEITPVAGGYQFRTRSEFADVIRAGLPDRTVRLSRAALETLAVVAYRQPVTRAEIDDVRSVDCGAVLRSLLERSLVRIVGRRDAPGRPALYGTSHQFLETFGLNSLRDLPPLAEFAKEELAPSAGLAGPPEEPHAGNGVAIGTDDPQVEPGGSGTDLGGP